VVDIYLILIAKTRPLFLNLF